MIVKVHEGYLIKTSSEGSFKTGRKRWFVIYHRNNYPYLRYYKHQPKTCNDRPLFDYPLGQKGNINKLKILTETRFKLLLDHETQLTLQADSREEAQIWISIIRSHFESEHAPNTLIASDEQEVKHMVPTVQEHEIMFPIGLREEYLFDGQYPTTEKYLDEIDGIPPNPEPPPFDSRSTPIVVESFCKPIARLDCEKKVTASSEKPLPRLVISPTNYAATNVGSSSGCGQAPATASALGATGTIDRSPACRPYGPVLSAIRLLQEQIVNPGGVTVQGMVNDFRSFLAVVELDHRVWIAGWDSRCVRLHGLFHVGDQLMELGGLPVNCVKQFYETLDVLEQGAVGLKVCCSLRLRRLPHGKVFAVRRTRPGQSIGLRLVDGTNQVSQVVPDGLAARIGLPAKTRTYLDGQLAHEKLQQHPWTITEINGQTLSLISRKSEACILLNAYGNDVTVVVQPADFVEHITQKLRKFRSAEQYIPR